MSYDHHKSTNPADGELLSTHLDEGREAWGERMIAHLERLLATGDIAQDTYEAAMGDVLARIIGKP